MGLVSGSVSCTRFNVVSLPEQPQFDLIPFRPIQPGSSIREKEGFIPFEPDEPYEVGARRWAFRVRVDKVALDATVIRERVMELVKIETEAVGPPGPKMRQKLKMQAEEELMEHPMPRSKVIECLLNETTLYVGTTSKGHLGLVLELLKRIGVEAEFKTPWLDAGQEEDPSGLIELKEPGQSVWGCRFLQKLMDDPDTFLEPEKGGVRMITSEGVKVSLGGPIVNEMDRMLNDGALLLSAKLLVDAYAFTLDALSYRIASLALDNHKNKHWTEALDIRMEKLEALWEWLDTKYQTLVLQAD